MFSKLKETIVTSIALMNNFQRLSFTVDRYADSDVLGYFRVIITHRFDNKDDHDVIINWSKSCNWEVWSDKIDSFKGDDYNDVRFDDSEKMMTYIFHILNVYENK